MFILFIEGEAGMFTSIPSMGEAGISTYIPSIGWACERPSEGAGCSREEGIRGELDFCTGLSRDPLDLVRADRASRTGGGSRVVVMLSASHGWVGWMLPPQE